MKQGFLHPNCRHGLTTYYPELEGISYDKEENIFSKKDKEDLQYYSLLFKKYKRLEHGFFDKENIKNSKEKKKRIKEEIQKIYDKYN